MYIKRAIESKIIEASKFYPIVMVCGPRQVGKTTVLQEVSKNFPRPIKYVTFDNISLRTLAKSDPQLFLQQYEPPLFIDEFQYAPEILPYLKMKVDAAQESGQYFLTGSQLFPMMKNVSESLAGRVAILTLTSLSDREMHKLESQPFLPTNPIPSRSLTITQLFQQIYRGTMPKVIANPELTVEDFYASYISTYIERDIREITNIQNESKFLRFLGCLAARTGQELIINDLAKDVEIDNKTAAAWLSILLSSGLVFALPPYFNNTIKRLVKRNKIYFMDTGLACYLTLWNNPQSLMLSAMAGAMFETYVVSEVVKSYFNAGKDPKRYLSYYRDTSQKEIDLLINSDNIIYPIEIKKSAALDKGAIKNFSVLNKISIPRGKGAVICMIEDPLPLDEENICLPITAI